MGNQTMICPRVVSDRHYPGDSLGVYGGGGDIERNGTPRLRRVMLYAGLEKIMIFFF